MNKCIILCMCCNEPQYVQERLIICETWGRHVLNGEYENLDLWFYTSSDTTSIDIDNHIIYVNTDDGLYNTWEKTRIAFEILNKYFDYDFIFRTNCSTVINCQLLSAFINTINKQSDDIWTCALHDILIDDFNNVKMYDYYILSGWAMLFSKTIISHIFEALQYSPMIYENNTQYLYPNNDINDIKDMCNVIVHKLYKQADDNILSYLLYEYYKHNNDDYIKHYKQFTALYYKTFEKNRFFINNNDLGYDSLDLNYYSSCLCVRAKCEYINDKNLRLQQTHNSIYELSKMYETKINDNILCNIINTIHKNSKENITIIPMYMIPLVK